MPRKEQQQQQQLPPSSSSCSMLLRRRSFWIWLMIVIGLAMAVVMLVQQMVLVHSHESIWNDFNADWKVANFAQERHHYDNNDVEKTNYTWVETDEESNNASIGHRSNATRRRIPRLQQQLVLLEQQQRARTAATANGSDVSNAATADDINPWRTVLASAGVQVTAEQEKLLPELDKNWKELFGMEPIIMGMETCESYRTNVPQHRRIVAVAGLFNTGTNAMEFHLQQNIMAPSKWQVPWGKHRDPSVRLSHVAPGMDHVEQRDVLPIVIVRDPYHWLQSMCKSPYAAKWKRTKDHCPNLVPTADDQKRFYKELQDSNQTFPVTVVFSKDQIMTWESLAHLYSAWYLQYVNADYPHLIVRFEDMLWQAEYVLQHIADCLGTIVRSPISHQTKSAKNHGSGTDYLKAIFKSGNQTVRNRGLTDEDKKYAAVHFDPELLALLNYKVA